MLSLSFLYFILSLYTAFHSAAVFNADLSRWYTFRVTNMDFSMCHSPFFVLLMILLLLILIRSVCTYPVTIFDYMYNCYPSSAAFYGASKFNADLSQWGTSRVDSMDYGMCLSLIFYSTSTVRMMFSYFLLHLP